jgi:hypothetical protein
MVEIKGNTVLRLQAKTGKFTINSIGERVPEIVDYKKLRGFLDLSNGDTKHTIYNAKIQESDHIFICDYVSIEYDASQLFASVNNKKYEVIMIDNPMGLNKHLEIYLRYVGE